MTVIRSCCLLSLLILTFSFPFIAAFADSPAAPRYVTVEAFRAGSGDRVPAGVTVELLGTIPVDSSVAASGKLATFVYEGSILTADAALFYESPGSTNFSFRSISSQDNGKTASVCSTLVASGNGREIDLTHTDLTDYLRVFKEGVSVDVFTIEKHPNSSGYSRWENDFCVSGLAHSTTYQVTLLKGLPIKDCLKCEEEILQSDITFFGKTPDRAPSIFVNSAKTILPLHEDAVIPVSLTNVKEIDIEVHRIDPRTISSVSALFENLRGYDVERMDDFYGVPLGKFSLQVPIQLNQTRDININLDHILQDQPPGLFVAVFTSEELGQRRYARRSTQWFVRSNTGITLYSGLNETVLFLNSFETGAPVRDAFIQVIAGNNRLLFEGESDEYGAVTLPNERLRGTGGNAPKYLFARSATEGISILTIRDLTDKPRFLSGGIVKSNPQDVYITTEREMYRTGDTIHLFGIARNLELDPIHDLDLKVELINPNGEIIRTHRIATDRFGALSLALSIDESAVLGQYQIRVSRMDKVILATAPVQVDDFVPLTIEPKISIAEDLWALNETYPVELSAEYFSGGPAAKLNGELSGRFRRVTRHADPQWEGYLFGTHASKGAVQAIDLQDFELDADGRYTTSLDTEFQTDPTALYEFDLLLKVFDVGGRPNRVTQTVPVDTQASYVGLLPMWDGRLDTGDTPIFHAVQIDRAGTALPLDELDYRVARISYSYDWYYDQGWHWRRTRTDDQVVESGVLSQSNFSLRAPLDWGSYEITVENAAGFQTTFPFDVGWGANQKPASEPQELSMTVQKVTDTSGLARLSIPFPGKLRILVATSDILNVVELDVEAGPLEQEIALPEDVEPGYHLLATLIRPIKRGSEHLPQIALGSAWVENLAPHRRVEFELKAPGTLRSTEGVTVSAESAESEGTVQFFLVDEGIHAVTGFQNPDPTAHFFGPRALTLGFASNFGQLIRQDDTLEAFRVGGDEAALTAIPRKSNFFKTVAAVSPLLDLENGLASYTFPSAGVEGRLRFVAFVTTEKGVGFETSSITVQDPVSLDISLPRFIATGDQISGKLALRANQTADTIQLDQRVGREKKMSELSLTEGQSFSTALDISANSVGKVPVQIGLNLPGHSISRNFELVSRYSSYPHTEVKSVLLPPRKGSGHRTIQIPPLTANAFNLDEQADLSITVSLTGNPGVGLGQILNALDRYPYGCIEQTSSTTRGLIYRSRILGANADTAKKINAGVHRILAMQKTSGAFGYWSRQGDIYKRYQPYAVETVIMALPYAENRAALTAAITKGLDYLYQMNTPDIWTQLYTYGVLAENGYEVTSRARYAIDHELDLNEIHSTREKLERLTRAFWLADRIHDTDRMTRLNAYMGLLVGNTGKTGIFAGKDSTSKWQYPGDLLADQKALTNTVAPGSAHFLVTLSAESKTFITERIVEMTKAYLATQKYRSTYANAKLAAVISAQNVSIAGTEIEVDRVPTTVGTDGSIHVTREQLRNGFTISHLAPFPLVLNAEIFGVRHNRGPVDNGFQVKKTWHDKNGYPVSHKDQKLEAKQGDIFTVLLEITAGRDFRNGDLLLTDLLPSGFEIEDVAVAQPKVRLLNGNFVNADLASGKEPGYVQKMDDRYVAHFKGNWVKTSQALVAYTVRAVYPGRMVLPDAYVEFMYQPEINGRSEARSAIVEPR